MRVHYFNYIYFVVVFSLVGCSFNNTAYTNKKLLNQDLTGKTIMVFPFPEGTVFIDSTIIIPEDYISGADTLASFRDTLYTKITTLLQQWKKKALVMNNDFSTDFAISIHDTTYFEAIELPMMQLPDLDFTQLYFDPEKDSLSTFYIPRENAYQSLGSSADFVLMYDSIRILTYNNAQTSDIMQRESRLCSLSSFLLPIKAQISTQINIPSIPQFNTPGSWDNHNYFPSIDPACVVVAHFIVWDYRNWGPLAWGYDRIELITSTTYQWESCFKKMLLNALSSAKLVNTLVPASELNSSQ